MRRFHSLCLQCGVRAQAARGSWHGGIRQYMRAAAVARSLNRSSRSRALSPGAPPCLDRSRCQARTCCAYGKGGVWCDAPSAAGLSAITAHQGAHARRRRHRSGCDRVSGPPMTLQAHTSKHPPAASPRKGQQPPPQLRICRCQLQVFLDTRWVQCVLADLKQRPAQLRSGAGGHGKAARIRRRRCCGACCGAAAAAAGRQQAAQRPGDRRRCRHHAAAPMQGVLAATWGVAERPAVEVPPRAAQRRRWCGVRAIAAAAACQAAVADSQCK